MNGDLQQGNPRMTAAQFRKMHGASKIGSDHENKTRSRLQNPIAKPPKVAALAGADEGQGGGSKRPRVLFTSFRCRLLDKSNLWGGIKSIEDCLVESGLIQDDGEDFTEINVAQVRVAHLHEQRTEIEIDYPL